MLRKVELDALRADLAAVDNILKSGSPDDDPIGHHQFEQRRREIEGAISELESVPDNTASVGLFFGGHPVIGSRGIRAEFAGRAIDYFQDLVSKRHAAAEVGMLGARGPVALRARTDLMVTDVIRGSIGLVLEEVEESGSLVDSKLKPIVDEVADIVTKVAAPDEEGFEQVLTEIDGRTLSSLRDFFQLLDDQGATMRLVESTRDESFDRASIQRGRVRTQAVLVDDRETDEIAGKLFILPKHRRFELIRQDTGEMIYGVISAEYSAGRLQDAAEVDGVVGRKWRTRIRVRQVRHPNRPTKYLYTLLGLLEEIDPSPSSQRLKPPRQRSRNRR